MGRAMAAAGAADLARADRAAVPARVCRAAAEVRAVRVLRDVAIPAGVIAAGLLLNAEAVHARYTLWVMLAISAAALASRYAVVAWLVCSTVVPDPVGTSVTNTQGLLVCLAAGYLVLYPSYLRGVDWKALRGPAVVWAALALWVALGVAVHGDWSHGWELLKTAVAVPMLAIVVAHRGFNLRRGAVVCVAAGVVGIAGYWFHVAGIPQVAAELTSGSLYVRDVSRLTSGKADPNAIGLVLVPLLAWGLWLPAARGQGRRSAVVGAAAVTATVPAIVFTCSRGTTVAVPLVLGLGIGLCARGLPWKALVALAAVSAGLVVAEAAPGALVEKLAEFRDYFADRGLGGRLEYWTQGVRTVLEHPGLGMGYARHLHRYRMVPHNTLLDFGIVAGLPALAGVAAVWAAPLVSMARRPRLGRGGTAGLALVVLYSTHLVLSMSLSMPTNKLVWVYGLMLWLWLRRDRDGRLTAETERPGEGGTECR